MLIYADFSYRETLVLNQLCIPFLCTDVAELPSSRKIKANMENKAQH